MTIRTPATDLAVGDVIRTLSTAADVNVVGVTRDAIVDATVITVRRHGPNDRWVTAVIEYRRDELHRPVSATRTWLSVEVLEVVA